MSQKASKYLKKIYETRRAKNASYSMRAFARDCRISGGRMSEYFVGKRQLTYGAASSICESSNLSEGEKENLMSFFHKEKLFKVIEDDTFQYMNNPLVYAILSAMDADDFKGSADWLSERLGESIIEVQNSIQVLIKLGLVDKSQNSEISLKQRAVKTTDNISSQSIRESHKIRLKKIVDNIDFIDVADRHVTSMTMCISKVKLDIAKQKIESFLDEMSELLECSEQNDVYELNVQLFPWKVKQN